VTDDDDDDDDELKFNLPFSTLYYPVESNVNNFTALCFHVIDVLLTVRSDFILLYLIFVLRISHFLRGLCAGFYWYNKTREILCYFADNSDAAFSNMGRQRDR
jgi:hypothetical protein